MSAVHTNLPFVFIDDAHTFGGTQTAMAESIRTILQETNASVLCICTPRTQEAVQKIAGDIPRLRFLEAPSALPLNLLMFPLRVHRWRQLLKDVRNEGVRAWWLNLADIEFGLAPLMVLRSMGESPRAYLQGTSQFTFFHKASPWKRRALSWVRDVIANRFAFRLHPVLITPSLTSLKEVQDRITSKRKPILGYLYYPPIGNNANSLKPPSPVTRQAGARTIDLWMIGNIVQGHKNNRAALDVLETLAKQGHHATLTVAGLGPDLPAFEQEALQRGLADRITYLGWVTNPCDSVPSDAIIFIPSFHETMNIVAREAMRNGLRIVVSPIQIFHEWIPAPLIAMDFSAESFAAKILEVHYINADDLAMLYRNALARFSYSTFTENFLRYSSITSSQ